ncbi:MAG: hypothetical protein FJX46_04230 [Alphaproteobacteria bacterium]|nr:hypothetical protein [Alphaproteobacteria bacterium]
MRSILQAVLFLAGLVPALALAQTELPSPRHFEGRIAYMKTLLDIKPEQQALWAKVEDAMRQGNTAARAVMEKSIAERDKMDALRRLELRAEMADAHSAGVKRFAEAFRPLYAALSDDQKKLADDLVARQGQRRMGMMRRG